MNTHAGACHCGAIEVELRTPRDPARQILGACQCSFCRKHNARTFSDPRSTVTLQAVHPEHISPYRFELATADVIVCGRCGVYVAMVLQDGDHAWCTLNIDTLDEREKFPQEPQPRDFNGETTPERVARRKSRWCPTTLVDWPA